MELGLKNKIAFVAASSQGLGKAVALELANEGVKLIINGRNQDNLKSKNQVLLLAYLMPPILIMQQDIYKKL